MPAHNERFCEMAAVTPQTILWEIERYYPAASVVEAATSQSRWDVICYAGAALPIIHDFLLKTFYGQISEK